MSLVGLLVALRSLSSHHWLVARVGLLHLCVGRLAVALCSLTMAALGVNLSLGKGRRTLLANWLLSFIRLAVVTQMVQVLRDQDLLNLLSATTPVDGGFDAHVAAYNFFLHMLEELWWLLRHHFLSAHNHGVVIVRATLDLLQKLVVPLYFVNHLAVNILDVEVFTGHQQGTSSHSCIQRQTRSANLVDTK